MTNKNYIRGYEKERQAVNELREQGYESARSAGSHGVFDVFALNETEVLAIQVKRVKKPCNEIKAFRKDIESIRAARVPTSVQKWLWVWTDKKGWNKIMVGDGL